MESKKKGYSFFVLSKEYRGLLIPLGFLQDEGLHLLQKSFLVLSSRSFSPFLISASRGVLEPGTSWDNLKEKNYI